VSFLLTPGQESAGLVAAALRATVQMSAFLMVALVARWLADGSADAMIDAIRGEAAARQRLAADVLAGHAFSSHPNGHHIWMALPRGWGRTEFASHVQHHALIFAHSDAEFDGIPVASDQSTNAAPPVSG
jgi:DNA-binding transcriptional MocR family regulator